jgi:hypothetical protein
MSTSVSPSPVRTQLSHLRTRSAVSDALQAAISGGLAAAVTTTVLGGLNAKPKGKLTTASKEKDTPYRVSSLANISTHKL